MLTAGEDAVIAGDAQRGSSLGRCTCAVGEKGAMAGMLAGGVALALAIPNMRGLT